MWWVSLCILKWAAWHSWRNLLAGRKRLCKCVLWKCSYGSKHGVQVRGQCFCVKRQRGFILRGEAFLACILLSASFWLFLQKEQFLTLLWRKCAVVCFKFQFIIWVAGVVYPTSVSRLLHCWFYFLLRYIRFLFIASLKVWGLSNFFFYLNLMVFVTEWLTK
jgi:hypothetical protein